MYDIFAVPCENLCMYEVQQQLSPARFENLGWGQYSLSSCYYLVDWKWSASSFISFLCVHPSCSLQLLTKQEPEVLRDWLRIMNIWQVHPTWHSLDVWTWRDDRIDLTYHSLCSQNCYDLSWCLCSHHGMRNHDKLRVCITSVGDSFVRGLYYSSARSFVSTSV